MIMDWYKTEGYQFVALSDHNILAEGDKWVKISEDSVRQKAFKNYLNNYGQDWVNHRMESGRIQVKLKTYEEYKFRYEEEEKFLIIRSREISDTFEDKQIHVNATNIQVIIEARIRSSV